MKIITYLSLLFFFSSCSLDNKKTKESIVEDLIIETPEELAKKCFLELKASNIENLQKLGIKEHIYKRVKKEVEEITYVSDFNEQKSEYKTSIFEILTEISEDCGNDFEKLQFKEFQYSIESENGYKILEGEILLKHNKLDKIYSLFIDAIKVDDVWSILTLGEFGEIKTEKEEHIVEKEQEVSIKTYCNSRFNFCIDYPSTLYPQGESDNGDGQVFKSKDAKNKLVVFGRNHIDIENDIETALQSAFDLDSWGNNPDTPQKVITYKKLGKTFYVVSGYNNGKIFYQKTILLHDREGLGTALIEYSESEKVFYNKISETIFKTFK